MAQTFVTSVTPVSNGIQTGFVVVTPISGTGQGLSVSETFGVQTAGGFFQASVLNSPLVTLTDIVATSDPNTGLNTGIAMVNPNDVAATVTLTLGDQQGATAATRTITVGPHQQVSRFVTELFSGQPVTTGPATGLLIISSTEPIAVLGLSFNGQSFTSLPVAAQLTVNNVSTGAGVIATSTAVPGSAITAVPVFSTVNAGVSVFAPLIPSTITQIPSTFVGIPQTPATGTTTTLTGTPVAGVNSVPGAPSPLTGTTFSTGVTNVPVATTVLTPISAAIPQITTGVGGTGAFLLPQVATGGGWVSQITISNISGTPQTVRVDFFNSLGGPLTLPFGSSVSSILINPGGVATLSTGP
jgi:hypothetical protein